MRGASKQAQNGGLASTLKLTSERASRKDNMDNYFAEDNAVKFDHQNGKIETICFCVTKNTAKRIAAALNLLDNQEG